jgi:hypothetical protein
MTAVVRAEPTSSPMTSRSDFMRASGVRAAGAGALRRVAARATRRVRLWWCRGAPMAHAA